MICRDRLGTETHKETRKRKNLSRFLLTALCQLLRRRISLCYLWRLLSRPAAKTAAAAIRFA